MRSSFPHTPSLRPLSRGLMLALAMAPFASTSARDLDREEAYVEAGDPIEEWNLVNDSLLVVKHAATQRLTADDSILSLEDSTVNRSGSGSVSVQLTGRASFTAARTTFNGGGISVGHNATAQLAGNRILVTPANGLNPAQTLSIGLDMSDATTAAPPLNPSAIIHSTLIRVADTAAANDFFSGLGLRMAFGQIDLLSGSRIEAANNGALLYGLAVTNNPVRLNIDASSIESVRGAAIRIASVQDATFNIAIRNGSQLVGGDGNLLLVNSLSGAPVASRNTINFSVDDARLAGNLTFDTTTARGTLDVVLRNKAQIDGRFINVTSASIDSDSTWLMTGDSNVGHLALGSTGTVALGNASTFNTLTVDSFDGTGGTLLFNTHLGDDSSATDKLVINGDANGQANVRVLNAGGAGAKTDRGIELIDIGGASNAQFDLVGRAVGGQYEYFLVKDANGNWYLRSQTGAGPDPCVVDPTLPECTPIDPVDPVDPIDPPPPVLRPEAGAYLATQFALDQLLRHTYRDRQGGSTAATDGVRGWARVDATQSKLGAVDDQLDLRVDRSRLQLGADVGVFDNGRGRVGVMGTAARSSATSRSDVTGFSARGKVEGGALGVYGNWANDAMYVDAGVQRGQFRNRVQGEGLAEERYDSDIWQSSVEAGYRFNIGQIGTTALSLQPELQLVYTDAKTDVHTETNGTVVRALGGSGLSGRAGLRLQGEGHSAAGASVSPYLAANWYRDGAGNGIAFDDEVLKAGIPRNRYELSAGARVEFRSGFSAWGGFGVMRGDSGYREATANLSVAYT